MRKMLCTVLAIVLVLSVLSGCGSSVTVSVQAVSLITGVGSVGLYDRYAGIVEAGQTIKLEKAADLEIMQRLVSVGELVTEGQELYSYDTEAISLDLEKKKLEMEQYKNSIETKTVQIAQLEKEKASASASDKLDYTIQIQELQVDITEAKFNISAKEKEIAQTQSILENAKVVSPVDGCVQSINESGGTDDNGNPLPYMVIAQTGAFRVKGTINEQNAQSLSGGIPVIIRSRTDDTVTWSGTISEVDWNNPVSNNNNGMMGYMSSDISSEATTSSKYPFYVTLDSDDGLMLGQHVYIEPDYGQEGQQEFSLSAAYIVDADSSPYVWAANKSDKLEKRSVMLGEYNAELDSYPILDGLTTDDYIAFPDETCQAGASVSYYDESSFGQENGGMVDDGMNVDDGMIADDGMVEDGGMVDEGMIVDEGNSVNVSENTSGELGGAEDAG